MIIIKKRAIISFLLTIAMVVLSTFLIDNLKNYDLLLIAIAVISFLSFYKFFDYLANFKTIENKSRIDILFLFIFFVWLFVPISYITDKDYSFLEGRPRAKWVGIYDIETHKLNYEFGKNFNDWFNDRFCLRDDLVKFFNQVSLALLGKSNHGYIDGDWLYRGYYKPNSSTKSEDIDALIQFNDFCKKNNIKLYVLIVPEKNDIYLSKKSYILHNKNQEDFQLKITACCKNNDIKIIYPFDVLNNAKDNEPVYFKTEHHWTDYGAYLGYSELMKVIKTDFPNVKIQTPNHYTYFKNNLIRGDFYRNLGVGTTCRSLGISKKQAKKYHKTPYTYWKHKNFDKLKVKVRDISLHRDKHYYYPCGYDKKVILLGTSQSENLCEFLPFSFKNVLRLRNNNVKDVSRKDEFKIMKRFQKDILEYKPDILVFCITKGNIPNLRNMFDME